MIFSTGDIGEWQPNGSMKIIDRKKNIFKLSQGEYVAVENLENIFGQVPSIESVCPENPSSGFSVLACSEFIAHIKLKKICEKMIFLLILLEFMSLLVHYRITERNGVLDGLETNGVNLEQQIFSAQLDDF